MEQPIVVEAIANFSIDFKWSVVVKSAKSQAVIQQDAMVGYIGRIHGNGSALAKGLSRRKIKTGVVRKILPRILRVWIAIIET